MCDGKANQDGSLSLIPGNCPSLPVGKKSMHKFYAQAARCATNQVSTKLLNVTCLGSCYQSVVRMVAFREMACSHRADRDVSLGSRNP